MEFLDNLKESLKSGKETAIMNSVMSMFGSQINAIKPENEIAEFIEKNMPILFRPVPEHEAEFGAMAEIVGKLLTAEANKNPEYGLKKMLEFYEAFRVWYKDYRFRQQG